MAGFLLAASLPQHKTACNVNACIVNGASATAARTAAKAAKPLHIAGELPDALIDAWSATQISASDLTLIGAASVNWIRGHVPVAGLGYPGA